DFFFFPSRRRHTSFSRDWSSDVCSSDLLAEKMRREQAEEANHSDRFIGRILFLKGSPKVAFEKPPVRAQTLRDMFASDLKDEEQIGRASCRDRVSTSGGWRRRTNWASRH